MGASLNQIPRAEKRDIARKIKENLEARAAKGPPEPALDIYISECTDITDALDAHVTGNVLAHAERAARLAQLEAADDEVDTCYRHIEGYIGVESRRRVSPNVLGALALHQAAFPNGLAHVDDPIADENRVCREALLVLRAPEHAATLAAIELPTVWLERWEKAILKSDALLAEVEKARTEKRAHIDAGRDAETEWVELMVRLRRYVSSRAKRSDAARIQEGKVLLAPLLDAMAKLRAGAAARATRKENGKQESPAAGDTTG
ncbi:hypothetical protein [Polyangium mundeleinium]|uniref:Uncharacterized protein n=1 Tax=Polyangium mundeleinium TaxID=2995306 RepID=A0ABT5ESZ4_9BACT|nr:hypothetical protein [Polyangium mundeleinium]MDC0744938.1 hypothetical protein [Polyangium mundeleinium]